MSESERVTLVKVRVVDFSKVIENAKESLTKRESDREGREVVEASCNCAWAYVDTPNGVIMLNSEGIGDMDPVSETAPFQLEIFGKYRKPGETASIIDIYPVLGYKFTDSDEIRGFPFEEKSLADFIRKFGSRLEYNFNIWNKFLTSVVVA